MKPNKSLTIDFITRLNMMEKSKALVYVNVNGRCIEISLKEQIDPDSRDAAIQRSVEFIIMIMRRYFNH